MEARWVNEPDFKQAIIKFQTDFHHLLFFNPVFPLSTEYSKKKKQLMYGY